MRKYLIVMLHTILSGMLNAQELEWIVSAGGLKSDKATTIAVDAEGNSFITGYYNEQAQFGPHDTGFSFSSSKEAFVAKIDPDGNFLWVRNGLNYYDDRGLGLCLDPEGNVYVTGTCWGGLQWGSLNVYNSTSYTDQIFVVKLDTDGNEIWMKNAGTDNPGFHYSDDHGQDIISDSQGNLFVTGFLSNNTSGTQDAIFDAINITLDAADSVAFLAKLTNDGVWQWVEIFDGIHGYRDNAVGVDDDDNVYVVGGFAGTSTFGTETITSVYDSEDIYVVKYSNDGVFQYVRTVGDSLADRADGITYGYDGHMYLTGEFRGEVYFGTDDLNNYGSPEDKDIFVSKMSKDGDWIWATKAGSTKGGDRGIGICANEEGNIYVVGQYRGDAQFGDHQTYMGEDSTQMYVALINQEGKWQWVLDGGGPMHDRFASVACDKNCNIYFTGYYKNNMQFDTFSLTSNGGNDMVIGKMSNVCQGEEEQEPDISYTPTNVFSPNDDGVNDILTFGNLEGAEGELIILNRWGNVVYQSTNISQGWNGQLSNGEKASDGVYFYKLKIQYPDLMTETKSGFISLVR